METRQQLFEAAKAGDLEVVKTLIETDSALVHAQYDSPYETPLHVAAAFGQVEIVELLIARDAEVTHSAINPTQTPLHVAWQRPDNMNVIKVLVAHGAATSEILAAVYLDDVEEVTSLLDADPELVHACDEAGMTPLHRAAENGQVEIVELLLARGADLEARTTDADQTALGRSYYHEDVLEVLLAHGATVDIFTAVNARKADYVADLLRQDPSLTDARMWDMTPLHFAAMNDAPDMAGLLLANGADVNASGQQLRTSLHWAALLGRRAAVEWLVANGAATNAADEDFKTPRDLALEGGHAEIAELLQQGGARE